MLLKEFNDEKISKAKETADFQKVTGGEYKVIDHAKGTVVPRMTTKQYSELSGIRQYGSLMKSSRSINKVSPKNSSIHVKVMDMNTASNELIE